MDYFEELENEYKADLRTMKLRWEGIKLQAAAAKTEHPELSEQLDNYLALIKQMMYSSILESCDDDEERAEGIADLKFILGDDANDL